MSSIYISVIKNIIDQEAVQQWLSSDSDVYEYQLCSAQSRAFLPNVATCQTKWTRRTREVDVL